MSEYASDQFDSGYHTAIDQIELALEFFNWYCIKDTGKDAPLDKFYHAYQYYVGDTYHQLHINALNRQDFVRVINKLYRVNIINNTVHGINLRSVALDILYKNEKNNGQN